MSRSNFLFSFSFSATPLKFAVDSLNDRTCVQGLFQQSEEATRTQVSPAPSRQVTSGDDGPPPRMRQRSKCRSSEGKNSLCVCQPQSPLLRTLAAAQCLLSSSPLSRRAALRITWTLPPLPLRSWEGRRGIDRTGLGESRGKPYTSPLFQSRLTPPMLPP